MLSKYCCTLSLVVTYLVNSVALAYAQDDNPPGFISIDCGLPEGSDYTESNTGLYYKSDAKLIESGECKSLLPSITSNTVEKYFSSVRSFPQGKRNCYTIQPTPGEGHKYLIRASFMYGNYDSLNQFPSFDLNLGADTWSKIIIEGTIKVVTKEIIHILSSDYIHICLIDTGSGTPFISAIELRPFNSTNSPYTIDSGSLQTLAHGNCDSEATDTVIRFKDDIYDRRWKSTNWTNREAYTTWSTVKNQNEYLVPISVLQTSIKPININLSLQFSWDTNSSSDQFYMYLHFAETESLQTDEFREFNIYVNGKLWRHEPVVPIYLAVTSYDQKVPETGSTKYIVSLNKTERSTLPPIINAFELFRFKKFSNAGTNDTDVAAILNIKSAYGVIKDWQGDPCEPKDFLWEGLTCSYHSSDHSARIISLNLSNNRLTGELVHSIVNLTQLKTLDLSNNKLRGQVPGFLSQLAMLSVLNLKGNKFTGSVPAQLLENKRKGILSLSVDDSLGTDTEIKKKSNMSTSVVVIVVVSSLLLLATLLFGIWMTRKRLIQVLWKSGNQTQENIGDMERKDRQLTYSQVKEITKNFQTVLGEGAFGTVYHGFLDDIQVAVKMLSPSSNQGYSEFQTEASLLMRVHHKNLTSMIGYCKEGTNMGIIYEYMANGSLDDYLLGAGKSYGILSWEIRLQIALDAAQGLEYLHHGCKPAIIHRDVKPSNILLNEQFQAKLADFGLSKAYPAEGGTHVITVVAGTPGYIDPDYGNSNRLTEKSDVFSFGVVLLVMITGRPPISQSDDRTHITQSVECIVQNGDATQVVDPRFRGKYNITSVLKTVELALACASRNSSVRPTMSTVVLDLKECLALEFGGHDADQSYIIEMVSMDPESSLVRRPR